MTNGVLKNRTLSAAILDQLRQDILEGSYADGAPLKQDSLALRYGVSRIPVREALFQLEAEGLVQIVPHKGAIVKALSLSEINDTFALRIMLETRLLEQSVPRLTQDDFDALDGIQSAFAKAISTHDTARWGALNAELHMALYSRADLPRTSAIVGNLLATSERYTRIQLTTETAWKRADSQHADIISLCRMRKVEAACAMLKQHIVQVQADLAVMMSQRFRKTG